MKKTLFLFVLLSSFFAAAGQSPVAAAQLRSKNISAMVAGEVQQKVRLYSQGSRQYLSVRDLAELYDARLDWRPVSKKVSLTLDGRKLEIPFSGSRAYFGKTAKKLSSPSRLVKNDVLVPVDFVASEAFAAFADCRTSLTPGSDMVIVEKDGDLRLAVSSGTLARSALDAEDADDVEIDTAAVICPLPAGARKKLLILDAGHGGDDSGAIGPNGTYEKEINLAIVYELKKMFERNGGYDVHLTRSDDTFIPLVERTNIANTKCADLFISIHCNANPSRDSTGFEIYFMSENASDPEAEATALMENSVLKLEGTPNKKRARLQEVLWSLARNEFINESSELCSFITGEVTHRVKIPNRGVKQAGFYVLRGTQMPAVLVESAFLSNHAEEAMLRTKKFQRYIARSVYEGILKYELRREMVNAKR